MCFGLLSYCQCDYLTFLVLVVYANSLNSCAITKSNYHSFVLTSSVTNSLRPIQLPQPCRVIMLPPVAISSAIDAMEGADGNPHQLRPFS